MGLTLDMDWLPIHDNSIQFDSILYFRHRWSIYIGTIMTRSCTRKSPNIYDILFYYLKDTFGMKNFPPEEVRKAKSHTFPLAVSANQC